MSVSLSAYHILMRVFNGRFCAAYGNICFIKFKEFEMDAFHLPRTSPVGRETC